MQLWTLVTEIPDFVTDMIVTESFCQHNDCHQGHLSITESKYT